MSFRLPKKRKLPVRDPITTRNDVSDETEDPASDLQLKPGFLDDVELVTRTVGPIMAEELTEEGTDVWLLHCPKDVPIESLLLGKKMKLDGTATFGDDDSSQYETLSIPSVVKPSESATSITAITPNTDGEMRLVSAPIRGYILLRERLEEIPPPAVLPESRPPHTLPPNLKTRHSIYGAELDEVLKARGVQLPGRKKKKKSKRNQEELEVSQIPDVVDLEDDVPVEELYRTKRKSKKKQAQEDLSYTVPIIQVHEEKQTKKKKSRHLNGNDESDILNGDVNIVMPEPEEFEVELSQSQRKALVKKEILSQSLANGISNEEVSISKKSRKSKVVD